MAFRQSMDEHYDVVYGCLLPTYNERESVPQVTSDVHGALKGVLSLSGRVMRTAVMVALAVVATPSPHLYYASEELLRQFPQAMLTHEQFITRKKLYVRGFELTPTSLVKRQ